LGGTCQGVQPPFWAGAECLPRPDESKVDAPKFYFEVNGDSGEFYRLPFPNDIRRDGGVIDLDGHANPGLLLPEYGNPVDEYLEMVEEDLGGFGTMSAVFFRYNIFPDADTITLGESISIVDITPGTETYGVGAPAGYRANSERGRYICYNWLALYPSFGNPLRGGTTYAAIITTDMLAKNGEPYTQDEDFAAMLADTSPGGLLEDAWNKYAPLRDYLADQEIDPATIAAATVFTTGNPTEKVPLIREAVREDGADLAVEDLERDDTPEGFSLLSGTVSMPFYQNGTRPFAKSEDGGAFEYDTSGRPLLVEEEAVRFALSIPDGEFPENGWPVFFFAHGTGGDQRSFVGNGVAARMAALGVAVISSEGIAHGNRRGLEGEAADDPMLSCEFMFYNFANPRAARDNNLQAAAELFQLVRLVEEFDTLTTQSVVFDPDKMYFFGHSQGTQGKFLGAVYEPRIKGIVLSGGGGYLLESLLGKKEPFDVSMAIRLALMDVDVGTYHPLLNLVQAALDPVDPMNYRSAVFVDDLTEMGISSRHVFMSSGEGDSYSPDATHSALAKALWLKQSVTSGTPLEGLKEVDALPHSRSYGFGGGVTTVLVRYAPDGDHDGHYVMFHNVDAIKQTDEFVRTMLSEEYPVLVAP